MQYHYKCSEFPIHIKVSCAEINHITDHNKQATASSDRNTLVKMFSQSPDGRENKRDKMFTVNIQLCNMRRSDKIWFQCIHWRWNDSYLETITKQDTCKRHYEKGTYRMICLDCSASFLMVDGRCVFPRINNSWYKPEFLPPKLCR